MGLPLDQWVDRIFVISLARRHDRRALCLAELIDNGINLDRVEWFDGFDCPESGHVGCSRSHRMLLRKIADGPWDRCLVLEDDWACITLPILKAAGFTPQSVVWKTFCQILHGGGNLNERFAAMIDLVPDDWSICYLGAGYGEPPIARINRHVLRGGFMQMTHSYCITRDFARIWCERVDAMVGDEAKARGVDPLDMHPGPIDNVMGRLSHEFTYTVFQPRLTFQRASLSDITGQVNAYLDSASNPYHENLIPQ